MDSKEPKPLSNDAAPGNPSARSIWLETPNTGSQFRPWLDPFLREEPDARGGVIVCPGGGYGDRAGHARAQGFVRSNEVPALVNDSRGQATPGRARDRFH
jgi:hypothetical protein